MINTFTSKKREKLTFLLAQGPPSGVARPYQTALYPQTNMPVNSPYCSTVQLLQNQNGFLLLNGLSSTKRDRNNYVFLGYNLFSILYQSNLAYENSRFSSLFSARDVSRGGTSATQRQKFHGDDVNQYLHNTSGSHGVPHPNLFNFTFPLIDFTRVFFLSANELQQNSNASSREQYIPPILTVLLEIHRVYS